jgi:TRAP-type mannitol/chloroaromatic compound transport system permease large subunit
MDEITIGIIGVIILLGLFLTGLELAFAMALIGVAGYAYIVGPQQAMAMLANDFYDSLESYGLTVVPLFVLMGQIAFNAGIAKRLYDSAAGLQSLPSPGQPYSRLCAGQLSRQVRHLQVLPSPRWTDTITARNYRQASWPR